MIDLLAVPEPGRYCVRDETRQQRRARRRRGTPLRLPFWPRDLGAELGVCGDGAGGGAAELFKPGRQHCHAKPVVRGHGAKTCMNHVYFLFFI